MCGRTRLCLWTSRCTPTSAPTSPCKLRWTRTARSECRESLLVPDLGTVTRTENDPVDGSSVVTSTSVTLRAGSDGSVNAKDTNTSDVVTSVT
eukprot:265988-Prorocentrum_minimum.AAC.23